MEEVLKHPFGPIPWYLANSDGSMRKTNKAVLARELEKETTPAECVSSPSVCIIDGMNVIQEMHCENFSKLSGEVFDNVMPSHKLPSSGGVKDWKRPHLKGKLEGKVLYVTCGDKCFKLTAERSEEVNEMETIQQEAFVYKTCRCRL